MDAARRQAPRWDLLKQSSGKGFGDHWTWSDQQLALICDLKLGDEYNLQINLHWISGSQVVGLFLFLTLQLIQQLALRRLKHVDIIHPAWEDNLKQDALGIAEFRLVRLSKRILNILVGYIMPRSVWSELSSIFVGYSYINEIMPCFLDVQLFSAPGKRIVWACRSLVCPRMSWKRVCRTDTTATRASCSAARRHSGSCCVFEDDVYPNIIKNDM